jgi:hypothetical protein
MSSVTWGFEKAKGLIDKYNPPPPQVTTDQIVLDKQPIIK